MYCFKSALHSVVIIVTLCLIIEDDYRSTKARSMASVMFDVVSMITLEHLVLIDTHRQPYTSVIAVMQ